MSEADLAPHGFEEAGAGVAKVIIRGTMSPAQGVEFVRRMAAYQDGCPDATLIVDMTEAKGLDAGARKAIIDHERARPYGVCFLRASFAIKALVTLMLNASKLFGQPLPNHFTDDDAAALAWCQAPENRRIARRA